MVAVDFLLTILYDEGAGLVVSRALFTMLSVWKDGDWERAAIGLVLAVVLPALADGGSVLAGMNLALADESSALADADSALADVGSAGMGAAVSAWF